MNCHFLVTTRRVSATDDISRYIFIESLFHWVKEKKVYKFCLWYFAKSLHFVVIYIIVCLKTATVLKFLRSAPFEVSQ